MHGFLHLILPIGCMAVLVWVFLLVVHTWSCSPTPHGLDWTSASEVSAPKYFMDTVWISAHVGVS